MWSLLKSTAIRGILGFLQVMGIVVVAAVAQQWSHSFAAAVPDAICSASSKETKYLVENAAADDDQIRQRYLAIFSGILAKPNAAVQDNS